MQKLEQETKPAGYPKRILQDVSQVPHDLQQYEKKTIKCMLVGDNYGKTSLVQTFMTGVPQMDCDITVEDEYQAAYLADGKLLFLSILDMTGVDLFWRMRVPAYPTIDIFLLCFGLGNPESLQNIRDIWLREIRATCPDAQFLLIGLQADRRDVDSESWYPPVAKEKAISTAAELGAIKYVECSSKLNHGVREVFAEALLAGIEVVTAKNEQPTAALVPSFRTRLSIVRLPKKFLEFRGRLQGRREAERLQSVREEATDSSVQEDVKADAESQVMTITPEQQARASIDFEETLSRTWVYTHLDRRALLQASSMRDNATLTSRLHSSRETITPSRRSMLSVPMSWTTGDQRSVVSWGSAEHNATATLEIIEQYAANLESLQTELFDARFSPQTTQSYTNVSAGGHARMMLGNSYHHTTNHYVINYNLIIVSEAMGTPF